MVAHSSDEVDLHTEVGELLAAEDIARITTRMAHQIVENLQWVALLEQPPILLGIPTRGVPLAHRLAQRLTEISESQITVCSLDITLHRDDFQKKSRPSRHNTHVPCDINDRMVLLVDDVLYSGRTVRAALDALRDLGRPRRVQLAVLVDRGHRELPIRADYVGKNVPTSRAEQISVLLSETDGRDKVLLHRCGMGDK